MFHQDSPYFYFEPADVVTVWIALDDMDDELGPLQYVPGSHKWKSTGLEDLQNHQQSPELDQTQEPKRKIQKTASNHTLRNTPAVAEQSQFFADNLRSLLDAAAYAEGHNPAALEFVSMGGIKAGCASVHNGRTWHGSGRYVRTLGIKIFRYGVLI